MAIQIGEKKKKKSKIFILLLIVVIVFVGYKLFKKTPTENTETVIQTAVMGDIKNVDSTVKEINDIIANAIFQQLVSHNTVNLQPETVGKEDPFAN